MSNDNSAEQSENQFSDAVVDSEDTEEEIAQAPPTAVKDVTKKRAQYAAFENWFSQRARAITHDNLNKVMKTTDEEMLSLRTMMARQESAVIISSPRDYQVELFERAKKENTIAVLDTGSGKTLIAVLLLRHTIDQELEHRAAGQPHRISFFIVDKVALVFQQHAVLEANLSQEVDRLCGAMGCDTWTADVWHQYFSKNMVLVVTGDILLQCLHHAFISIEQINLLIFDEAHHAKKDHAFAKIIRNHYLRAAESKRPRVFGMTASPVDVAGDDTVDLQEKAKELEMLLSSRIVTISDSAILQQAVHRPKPVLFKFHNYHAPFESAFYQTLYARYREIKSFQKIFVHAKEASNELGSWCSDAYWTFAFSDAVAKRMEHKVQHGTLRGKESRSIETIDYDIRILQQAQEVVKEHAFDPPLLDPTKLSLSPKVLKLHAMLMQTFNEATNSRCIVFVEKRYTAKLLLMAFDIIGGEHLRPGILIGANAESESGLKYTLKQQVVTLMKFRKGDLNCLFATSVAEEGLDIQDCNIVIRFDPAKTMIQYVQSRGRGRQVASKFWHLVDGSLESSDRIRTLLQAESAMRSFCQTLPADRRLQPEDVEKEHDRLRENSSRVYVEPATGARLTYDFSLLVLAHFATMLPHDDGDDLSINYAVTTKEGKFMCEVLLPPQSPIRSAIGRPAAKKSTARRSAAFEACLALRKGGYLDANLLPIYIKQLPAMRNALLAVSTKASNAYDSLVKPKIWAQGRGTFPDVLYLTSFGLPERWDMPVQSLGLLTRQPLPSLPSFPVFRLDGMPIQVTITASAESFVVDPARVTQLTAFNLRLYKDLFNKTFEHDEAQMTHWVVPLRDAVVLSAGDPASSESKIDWKIVEHIHSTPTTRWTKDMAIDTLIGKFLVDPYDGGRRFFVKGVAKDLKPLDPVPQNVAPGGKMESIIGYSNRMWKASRQKAAWSEDQPVLEADKMTNRYNVLAEPNDAEQNVISHCYICPEPMLISQLPSQVVAMCLLVPAILYRIDCYLIAIEHAQEVGLDISVSLALEAITKDSENSGDSSTEEKINFQYGMGNNYERLELIGDTFLKMATSLSIFVKYAKIDEFQMHVSRMLMLCNKNMFEHATKRGLEKYIRAESFSRRTWYPEGLRLLSGRGAVKGVKNEPLKFSLRKNLGDKTIADVCEAMIGAAFVTHFNSGYGSTTQFDEAVKAVFTFVRSEDHEMLTWADYNKAYAPPLWQIGEANAIHRDLAERVEKSHKYVFKYPRLLQSAFLHASMPRIWDGLPSYQRLEFLGDALMDMTAVSYLWYKHKSADPQWLTEHKMALVSNRFLGAVCVKLGFHKHLRHNSSAIQNQITNFVEELELAREAAEGARNYWTTVKEAPKCLADIVESYVGAMFIDSGFNYAEVQRFFDEHIKWFFEYMAIYDTYANNHPVTRMYNLLSIVFNCQNFRLMANEIPADNANPAMAIAGLLVHDQMIAEGRTTSSRYAKIKCAVAAVDKLQGLSAADFREQYGCDCKAAGTKHTMQDAIGVVI